MAVPNFLILLCMIPGVFSTLGVDVSSYTNYFSCLHGEGYEFAIIRAYQSLGRPDPNAPQNIKNAHNAGIKYVDVYFFPHYFGGDAKGQVASFVRALSGSNYGMVWLDIEAPQYWSSNKANNVNYVHQLVSELQSQNPSHKIGIYSSPYEWGAVTGGSHDFTQFPLWYAHYDGRASFSDWSSVQFGGWSRPSIKQFAGTSSDGCGNGFDRNFY